MDPIQQAEERICRHLLDQPPLAGVPILHGTRADLDTALREALAKTLALCVVVEITGGDIPHLGDEEPWDLSILITEQNPTVARRPGQTAHTAGSVATQIMIALRVNESPAYPRRLRLVPSDRGIILEITAQTRFTLHPIES